MAHDFPEISEADGGFAPNGGCAAHAPAHLNAAAVTNGFAPRPLDPGFAWADFAPGDGLNAALHAAANPGGRFFAPASGARGRSLARQLENLSFDGDLPPLDFAVCDGGLAAWSDAERTLRLGRIAAALKPGGILLLGYHAQPGFAAMMPLRDVLHSLTADHESAAAQRVEAAFAWIDAADAADSAFLAQHPAVRRRLAALARRPVETAAAELFGPTLRPFHFAQVETSCRAAGLAFAGSAQLWRNMLDIAVPPAARPLLRGVKNRSVFETLRDALTNPFYRRDVFVKGAALVDEAEFWQCHDELIVGLAPDAPEGRDLGHGRVAFSAFPFDALVRGLADGPKRVADLPELIPGIARDAVRSALALGLVRAMTAAGPLPPPSTPGRLAVPHPLNRALLAGAARASGPVPLASPATGSFLELDRAAAVALDGLAAGADDDAGSAVAARLAEHAGRGATADSFRAAAEECLAALTPDVVATLLRYGVAA